MLNFKILIKLGLSLIILSIQTNAANINTINNAASLGDINGVRNLLRNGAEVNNAQGDGMTPLHWAAEIGNSELAKMLIYAGSNLEAGTRIGQYTPLHIASRNGHENIVDILLKSGANPNTKTTNSGTTAIHLAAISGNPVSVELLIKAGADLNIRDHKWGQTPLIYAASADRALVLDVLLKAGADHSISSYFVDPGQMEKADRMAENRISEFLAEFKEREGGGPNWQPKPSQVQAAILASRQIQEKWPNVPDPSCDDFDETKENSSNIKNKCANTVRYDADGNPVYEYTQDEQDKSERPLSYGEKVEKWGGLTPLLHAVRQGHHSSTITLINYGANINQVSAGDETSPLLMATINGQFDLALKLIQLGANPNLASIAGTTPLFATLERRWGSKSSYSHPTEHERQQSTHLDVIKALLDAGAEPNIRLKKHLWFSEYTFSVIGNSAAGLHYKGATPFWRAAHALDVNAMKMLKDYGADPHLANIKMPERRRRQPIKNPPLEEGPPSSEIKIANSKKSISVNTKDLKQPNDTLVTKWQAAEVPVGGEFISPIHVVSGAGYGQSWAANAHIHAPDAWLSAIKFLIEECGADVNLRDARGYTPLHHAASRGDNDAVKYLISKGADVMAVSRKGETTVDMANSPLSRVPPYPSTIALLENHGAINNHNCISC